MNPHLVAFAVGGLIGAAYFTARAIYWPYRTHVLRRP